MSTERNKVMIEARKKIRKRRRRRKTGEIGETDMTILNTTASDVILTHIKSI